MKSLLTLGVALAATALLLPGSTGNRRVTQNKLSPPADTSVQLGGHAVTIEYNAPSARGRKVEGGLIPYDHWYRLGADSATTLTADTDLMIGSLHVPKGVYTLYLYATSGDWKLIVNKQTGQWGTEYSESQDLGRVSLHLTKLSSPVETFKITLKPEGAKQASLQIEWGTSMASVPVKAM